jgi:hypothetical protein
VWFCLRKSRPGTMNHPRAATLPVPPFSGGSFGAGVIAQSEPVPPTMQNTGRRGASLQTPAAINPLPPHAVTPRKNKITFRPYTDCNR